MSGTALAAVAVALLTQVTGGCQWSQDVGPTPTRKLATSPTLGMGPSAADLRAAATEADTVFTSRCSPCHGAQGFADGPAAASLNPHPRNFHDVSWQAAVTDEHIMKIIQKGGEAVGKSALMPANPDLVEKQLVVWELAQKVRHFASRQGEAGTN